MKKTVLLVGLLLAASAALCLGEGAPDPIAVYRLATMDGLLGGAEVQTLEWDTGGEGLFVALLSGQGLAVVVRPMGVDEFGSFQVQAIAPEMIDLQMLAATVVLPAMTTQDVAALDPVLVAFLMRAINQVSGFAVFGDVAVLP